MYLLGLDVEGTGLDPKKDLIIEIGAVLWDTERGVPVSIFSHLIRETIDIEVPQEVTEITGIDREMLLKFGVSPNEGILSELERMMSKADAFAAHNAEFDKAFLSEFFERFGGTMPDHPWICTIKDIKYSKMIKHKDLTSVAAHHGFINPFPHRAVTDVLTMLRILSNYDTGTILENAKSPTIEVVALVSYADRQLAKDAGFGWDGTRKLWVKVTKESLFDAQTLSFGVKIQKVD